MLMPITFYANILCRDFVTMKACSVTRFIMEGKKNRKNRLITTEGSTGNWHAAVANSCAIAFSASYVFHIHTWGQTRTWWTKRRPWTSAIPEDSQTCGWPRRLRVMCEVCGTGANTIAARPRMKIRKKRPFMPCSPPVLFSRRTLICIGSKISRIN